MPQSMGGTFPARPGGDADALTPFPTNTAH